MNFYPFHIGDYAVHTRHLTPIEDLAYRRLLDLYYTHEAPIPSEGAARLIGLREYPAEVDDVLHGFFRKTPEGWRHARCDEEIARMRAKQENARESAAKRAARASEEAAKRERHASESQASATNTNTNTKEKKNPPSPLKGGADAGFDQFWKAYPAIGSRKAAKPQCLAKWKTKRCSEITARILRALEAQKASPKWQENAGEFVPAPLVWLNQERWTATEEADAAAPEWWETRAGANAMAKQLGVQPWDETEPFHVFRDRLRNLIEEKEAA
jgi:uncharacterized protein YdaU (DUF1376 family)